MDLNVRNAKNRLLNVAQSVKMFGIAPNNVKLVIGQIIKPVATKLLKKQKRLNLKSKR